MGSASFYYIAEGRTPEEAFRNAREDALYDYGHAGYTGTIAEKHEFVILDENWKTLKERLAKAVKYMRAFIKKLRATPKKRYDPESFYNELHRNVNPLYELYVYHLPKKKGIALEVLMAEAKRIRGLRNKCNSKMTTQEVGEMLVSIGDIRIDDKWGPAGCLDMDPRLTGKRKPKRFFFFGYASC